MSQRSYMYDQTDWSLRARKVRNRFKTSSLVILVGSLGLMWKSEYFDRQLQLRFAVLVTRRQVKLLENRKVRIKSSHKLHKYVLKHERVELQLYENKRHRMVVQPPARWFTPILSDNGLAYGSRFFSIYLSMYYCSVHAYCTDELTV